jgi:hypothetical protein
VPPQSNPTTSPFAKGATTNIEVIHGQQRAGDAEITAAVADDALRRARLDGTAGRFPQ